MDYIRYNDELTTHCRQLPVAVLNSVALGLTQCATLFNIAKPNPKVAHTKSGSVQASAGDIQQAPGFSTDATIGEFTDPRRQLRENASVSNFHHVEIILSTNRHRDALLNLKENSSSIAKC